MKYDFEIIGEIGYGYGSSEYVAWMLEGMQGREVNIRVNSLGGSAIAGLDIATRLKEHGNCTVHLMGMNASAATILAMGAKKVCMDSNGGMLIHKCMIWYEEWGNMNADDLRQAIEEMTKTANQADSYDAIALKWYMNRCGDKKKPEEVLELMKQEKFISADDALEWGFVDEVENCADAAPAAQARALAWVAQADAKLLTAPLQLNHTDGGLEAAASQSVTNAANFLPLGEGLNNNNIMKQYNAIATLAGLDSPYQAVADKEGNVGFYVAEAQAEVLESAAVKASEDAEALVLAKAEIATLTAAKADMEAKQQENETAHAAAIADMQEEHNKALDDLRTELNAASEATIAEMKQNMTAEFEAQMEAAKAEHATALAEKDTELATAQTDLAAANAKIADLEAELAAQATAAPEPHVPQPSAEPAVTAVKAYAEMNTAEKAEYMRRRFGK